MKRIEIPEETLRELLEQHSFQAIADMYHCGARAIAACAKRYGLRTTFFHGTLTDEQIAAIVRLRSAGFRGGEIAKAVGCSESAVYRHLNDRPGWRPSFYKTELRPTTSPAIAMHGVRFEDARVPESERLVQSRFRTEPRESGCGCAAAMCTEVA